MKTNLMKTNTYTPSTYALLARSEESDRSLSETAVYLLFIASAVFSIWQVAQQPINLPTDLAAPRATIAQTVTAPQPGV